MTRKDFIHVTAGVMILAGTRLYGEEAPQGRPLVRFGMVTDLHYAALKRVGRRYYRDSLRKLEEAVDRRQHSARAVGMAEDRT